MKWYDSMGNQYRLTYRPWLVDTMRFDGIYWVSDERSEGVLVEITTWLGDKWFVQPQRLLFTKQQIEARDARISDRLLARVVKVPCDCGCDGEKPADAASAAWNQAASLVRCEPKEPA